MFLAWIKNKLGQEDLEQEKFNKALDLSENYQRKYKLRYDSRYGVPNVKWRVGDMVLVKNPGFRTKGDMMLVKNPGFRIKGMLDPAWNLLDTEVPYDGVEFGVCGVPRQLIVVGVGVPAVDWGLTNKAPFLLNLPVSGS
ncbi:hypothetical protein NDU88_002087 [Pleurodeles waltl]|uniref:Uncharacterized protein n=1 Tax=Pleurodeles waltl TaxID=8319 RepID=A0AAV7UVY6_PLEWA|nr:hypothetical protein NDU88_002087 [Pleurodeles waltl]